MRRVRVIILLVCLCLLLLYSYEISHYLRIAKPTDLIEIQYNKVFDKSLLLVHNFYFLIMIDVFNDFM